jgi:hypothetical protein
MPLFFFDVRDGESFFRDDVGLEYPDVETARDEAALTLAEMGKSVLPGSIVREIAVEVRDEAKEPLLRTVLRFEVQRLR